ncbi:MAG TPA: outer membrane beta-barrel protein, partial [Flavisolibacter sp.]|nr:outer membrane beta-barrel protein [Flavisolibacter sp.]
MINKGTNLICSGLFAMACLLCCAEAAAQSKINGNVTGADKQPLSNASVLLLLAKDSSLVKGVVTNARGGYSFENVLPGNYLVSSSFAGFREVYSPLFQLADKSDVLLEALQLSVKDNQLNAVVVSARKPLFEQKIDRMIINVASSITNAGSTALDVLMRSPGIIVDQQNNTLSMNGKDGVVVMMNGKISRMPMSAVVQMLAGMSSGNIEKIELITTPPANFDAEGNAGYINIVMKTSLQYGTNGSYSVTAGFGKRPAVAASVNFNHRSGPWNVFGDYSFDRTGLQTNFSFYRKVAQGTRLLETEADTERDAVRRNHNGRLGIDFDVNSKTTIGALFSTFSNLYKMESVNTSNISVNSQLDTTIIIDNDERHPITNYSGNINLTHLYAPGERLSLNADYVYFNDANDVNYTNNYYGRGGGFLFSDLTRSGKETPIRFWVGSADYTKKFSEKVEMESGVKATVSRFTNDVQVERQKQRDWLVDRELTAIHFLKESIYAAYTSFSAKLSGKTSMKAGLRYEYTNSNLESETVKNIVDRHYGNLFPSVFLAHTINEARSVNFAYSRRITRPTFNDMAPFVYFVDPNTLFSGNPALQPSIANSFKSDYLI